jgi:hypothetical protein
MQNCLVSGKPRWNSRLGQSLPSWIPMNTAVLIDSSPARIATRSVAGGYPGSTERSVEDGYPGSSEQTTSLLFQPILKETRKSEPVIVPFSGSKADPEAPAVRLRIPKGAVWEWLELGFVLVLGASVLASVLIPLIAAGSM